MFKYILILIFLKFSDLFEKKRSLTSKPVFRKYANKKQKLGKEENKNSDKTVLKKKNFGFKVKPQIKKINKKKKK